MALARVKTYWADMQASVVASQDSDEGRVSAKHCLERWQSLASAPTHIMRGCSRKICLITLDPTSWSIKEVIARQARQPDYIAVTLSLSHGGLTVGLLCSPWYLHVHPDTGACEPDRETTLY